ncbi:diaminobutyrate acetyltransferase [Streptomyces sp. NPDC056600]|uniref:diaminobutyrate acetyltransferase n=1 Tax=Streptomyces sp. NPDC056600 TaxID=3345874 RepID=UPI0036B3754A
MTALQAAPTTQTTTTSEFPCGFRDGFRVERPDVADGAALWRIARDSRTLDLNSSYSYLLWCRDFAATSAVARSEDGRVAGFVTGFLRPEDPRVLLVWQVAVDERYRGHGLAGRMLDELVARIDRESELGVDTVETTITPGNRASERLFASFAARHGAQVTHEVLFAGEQFPAEGEAHAPEVLHRIAPL